MTERGATVQGPGCRDHRLCNWDRICYSTSIRSRRRNVACLDINEPANLETAASAEAAGGKAIALACDVRKRDQQVAAVDAVMDAWGRIDVLVASAGIYVGGPLDAIPPQRWEDILAVNLTGVSPPTASWRRS